MIGADRRSAGAAAAGGYSAMRAVPTASRSLLASLARVFGARVCRLSLAAAVALSAGALDARKPTATRDVDAQALIAAANDAGQAARNAQASLLRSQILLDRASFSVGEIDGQRGSNFHDAIKVFQAEAGLRPTGALDRATRDALDQDAAPVLEAYTISDADVAGPFVAIPADIAERAKLPALGYSTVLEALSERFHASPKLLTRLNPGKSFDQAGTEIMVPSVASGKPAKAASVIVSASERSVSAVDAQGRVLARFPASAGSRHDPLPIGKWKVTVVSRNPIFNYNPALFWDADASAAKTRLAPGPNNPVGVAWIGISKRHYGLHGTPEPAAVGRTQSHGCIRLTNWDIMKLADMVHPGTAVVLQQ